MNGKFCFFSLSFPFWRLPRLCSLEIALQNRRKQSLVNQSTNPFVIVAQKLDQLPNNLSDVSHEQIVSLSEPLMGWGTLDEMMGLAKTASRSLYSDHEPAERVNLINTLVSGSERERERWHRLPLTNAFPFCYPTVGEIENCLGQCHHGSRKSGHINCWRECQQIRQIQNESIGRSANTLRHQFTVANETTELWINANTKIIKRKPARHRSQCIPAWPIGRTCPDPEHHHAAFVHRTSVRPRIGESIVLWMKFHKKFCLFWFLFSLGKTAINRIHSELWWSLITSGLLRFGSNLFRSQPEPFNPLTKLIIQFVCLRQFSYQLKTFLGFITHFRQMRTEN